MRCVVLAGGGGLRLWPLSREKYPKQFLSLSTERTMFVETILRNKDTTESFLILTNDSYRFIVEDQMKSLQIEKYDLILETIGRNTAPAIALACFRSLSEELLLVVPADASIEDHQEYIYAIQKASEFASKGYIVTFGIKPDRPHTGYGYIKHRGYDVITFKEKPSYQTAVEYLMDGNYLWNSGMFLFSPKVFLSEMEKYCPDIYEACRKISEVMITQKTSVLPKEHMERIPSISVDYAVMEKSDIIKVIPSDFKWSDVGSLEAMTEFIKPLDNGNRIGGENVLIRNSIDTRVVNTDNDQLVVVNGMDKAIIVNTKDALYVTAFGQSSAIKEIIDSSRDSFFSYYDHSYKIFRPWGHYEILKESPGYRVRRITVNPQSRLSLHKHNYRSEHWTVVSGTATVVVDSNTYTVDSHMSMDIPVGSIHRLANNANNILEIIEISLGKELSENDIIRVEDDFNRYK